jgi:integrase
MSRTTMYTSPILYKGKEVKTAPKGSTRAKEQAKQDWYVNYSYFDVGQGTMKRFRITNNGNRIKDPEEKLNHFNELLITYKDLLKAGWSPFDEQSNEQLKRSVVSITLLEAKELFRQYHESKGTRKKSIQTYLSKLLYFVNHHGEDRKVNEITDYDITTFLNHHEAKFKWSGVTYVAARTALSNFFNFLKRNKYISSSPVVDIETRKKIKTEFHQVFSDEDFETVKTWLKENDPYMLLFVKAIYYTCIRPKELRYLQLKHIDLATNKITVPASIAKNKKAIPVHIVPNLRIELDRLNLGQFSSEYYLFGSTATIVGSKHIGENTPYTRFQRCLKATELLNKQYSLYSIKHLSNVRKYLNGWSMAQICAANRHSSLVETEIYLKHLLKYVPTDMEIPEI